MNEYAGDTAGRGTAGSVVCIGVFDGVHRGHRAVLDRGRQLARERGLELVVLTFDPHPLQVLRPERAPRMLTTLSHRRELLLAAGADSVSVIRFDRGVADLAPSEFAESFLRTGLRARLVVVGENFRFGNRAAGDVEQLGEFGSRMGFQVSPLRLVQDEPGTAWSSSRIRELVASGDVGGAAEGLGRPHLLEGTVVRGEARGRTLGFPTANLDVAGSSAVPGDGVYSGWLVRNPHPRPAAPRRRLPAAISVGANRTFEETEARVEAHVIGAESDLDLYGEWVGVEFESRLRPMVKFADVTDLVAQMTADVEQASADLSRGSAG